MNFNDIMDALMDAEDILTEMGYTDTVKKVRWVANYVTANVDHIEELLEV